MFEPKPRFIIAENGNKISVILSIDEYNELLTDIHNLKVVMDRHNEETLSINELKNSIKHHG